MSRCQRLDKPRAAGFASSTTSSSPLFSSQPLHINYYRHEASLKGLFDVVCMVCSKQFLKLFINSLSQSVGGVVCLREALLLGDHYVSQSVGRDVVW